MKVSELFRKYPKTPVFDHSNYRLFERIPAVPGTSNNRGLTVLQDTPFCYMFYVVLVMTYNTPFSYELT